MKTLNLAFGNVAAMAVLSATLAALFVTGANANADTYHRPYHRPEHRIMHHPVHPVSDHYEGRDTEHPHR